MNHIFSLLERNISIAKRLWCETGASFLAITQPGITIFEDFITSFKIFIIIMGPFYTCQRYDFS